MNRRIIYGLLIAVVLVVIGFCGNKIVKIPNKIMANEPEVVPEQDIKVANEIDEPEVVQQTVEEEPLYYGLTYDALVEQINKSLNSTVSGYGEAFVSKSLELGVDPYLAVGIMLHETGCKWNCSTLVKNCNNVGGMKGTNKCGSSSYRRFDSLEEGIESFITNIYNNYDKAENDLFNYLSDNYGASGEIIEL